MAERSAPEGWRTGSFAHERRGELPEHNGDFGRDAGKARAAFEAARSGNVPTPTQSPATEGTDAPQPEPPRRVDLLDLPEPHPSFAVPRHKSKRVPAAEQDREAPSHSDKETFLQMRAEQELTAKQNRARNTR